ncbi:MAG TPA: hypothetical protein VKA70_06100 [Blastocatellia bacterium]|nr:hypothetical protein [Blastocatellia bacterium]
MKNFNYQGQAVNPSLNRARAARPAAKTVPFDYVFQFALQGQRGNKVQDVVEISMEGVFVALSVGYSLVPDERKTPQTFAPVVTKPRTAPLPTLVPFFAGDDGVTMVGLEAVGSPNADVSVLHVSRLPGGPVITNGPVPGIDPSAPPRTLAKARLGPDGTARIQVEINNGDIVCLWDRTNDLLGQLFEFRQRTTPVIGPDPKTGRLPVAGDTLVHVYGLPGGVLGNSTAKVSLVQNTSGNRVFEKDGVLIGDTASFPGQTTGRAAVELSVPGLPPVPLSPGDLLFVNAVSLSTQLLQVPFSMYVVPRTKTVSDITIGEIEAGLEKNGSDLSHGFRLNTNGGGLRAVDLPLNRLSESTASTLFATSSALADEVSFLYSLDIGGTGREYQNKAIHNIAGLGIANGDRPFRPFAKPILFEPRSFIRIQVEELSRIPGTLFIVLQGYKMLGTSQAPQ